MKALILFILFFSLGAQAQPLIEVTSQLVDLGILTEKDSNSTNIRLKLTKSSPEHFKVKFSYIYKFVSNDLDYVEFSKDGQRRDQYLANEETFETKQGLTFNISESSIVQGDELEVVLKVTRPNKNTHTLKIKAELIDPKGNVIEGGNSFLNLFGHQFDIRSSCIDE